MRYVSIDIETLGLDSEFCDVIEIAAVVDDLKSNLEELQTYHAYVVDRDNRYRGEPYAMAMHSEILRRIAKWERPHSYVYKADLWSKFKEWICHNGVLNNDSSNKALVAGKNFAGFDMKFLTKIGVEPHYFHHRTLDPGSMFVTKDDLVPPSLDECLKRAGINTSVKHTALEDAFDVVKCVRFHLLGK